MDKPTVHTRAELRVFYGVVLVLALFGQSSGASSWLIPPDPNMIQFGLYWLLVIGFVAVLELGAVVLLRRAEAQRRAGERAWIAILTAIAIAIGAAALSWAGHWGPAVHQQLQSWAFAGSTLLGVIVWAIMADLRIDPTVSQHRAVREAVRRYVKALTMDNAEKAVLIATMNIPLITKWILDGPNAVEGEGHERDIRIARILATAIDPETWHGHQELPEVLPVEPAPAAEPAPALIAAPETLRLPSFPATAPKPKTPVRRPANKAKLDPAEIAAAYQQLYRTLGRRPSVTELGEAGASVDGGPVRWKRSSAGSWMQKHRALLSELEAEVLNEAAAELEGASA